MSDKDCIAQIEQHRACIDDIDRRLVELINERARHSLLIRNLKPAANLGLYDAKREAEILQKISAANMGPLYDEHLKEIYMTVLKVMKEAPSL